MMRNKMYKVKAFKKMNVVLGILKGTLKLDDLNTYGNEVVRTIEKKLKPGFTYAIDVSDFENQWFAGDLETDEKMAEIHKFLSLMGLENIYFIGANREIYEAHRVELKDSTENKIVFFTNLEEALEFIKRNREN